MKILAVSDEECPALWEYYTPGKLKDYDLILSCGDLNSKYLSFLVTMARCPLLYVVGNHDVKYKISPPEGCDPIDDHFVIYNGVRILGLGGCRRYNSADNQFTERQMRRRIRKLKFQLWLHRGVDIIVTHAAPAGLGDDEDPCHMGFEAFLPLLDKYKPAYLVHGHVHVTYGHDVPRVIDYNGTKIINAYERYVLELPDREVKSKHIGLVRYMTQYKQSYLDNDF